MEQKSILTLNAGSSTIKFAVYSDEEKPRVLLGGQVDRIGTGRAALNWGGGNSSAKNENSIDASSYEQAAKSLVEFLKGKIAEGAGAVWGIGHRIVHGGVRLLEHQRITAGVLEELRRNKELDLAHLPREIAIVEEFGRAWPDMTQVACFDTAFHRDLPVVSQRMPIPRKFTDQGIRKLGFHGLSYTYLMGRLAEIDSRAAKGHVLLAHLGSGASMAAVRDCKAMDTTMGFTPIAGLVMATRCGDIDPGLLLYLMRQEKMTAETAEKFISEACGLLGVSGTTGDMRDLLKNRAGDPRAAEAVELFCYQAAKQAAAMVATMDGLDTLVFAGGIGEHAPEIRAEICERLKFLGIEMDGAANARARDIISTSKSRVTVRVIATDEQIIIARETRKILLG